MLAPSTGHASEADSFDPQHHCMKHKTQGLFFARPLILEAYAWLQDKSHAGRDVHSGGGIQMPRCANNRSFACISTHPEQYGTSHAFQ
jgi:hypothetical protein